VCVWVYVWCVCVCVVCVCVCVVCVWSGRGLCDEFITRPNESYRGASSCVFCKPEELGGFGSRLGRSTLRGGGGGVPSICKMYDFFFLKAGGRQYVLCSFLGT